MIEEAGKLSELWADFGLPGLVIGTLFAALFFLLWMHRAERKEWRGEHREERTEAIKAFTGSMEKSATEIKRGSDNVAKVVEKLETVIQTQARR